MRHSWSISDSPDLPIRAFRKALGKNRPETLEGGKGGAPSAPDPYVTSDAQTRLNQATAAYNKSINLNNYSNPFGSQTSTITGQDPVTGAPIYQANISANPALQQLLNQQISGIGQNQGGLDRLSDYLGNIGMQSQGIASQYGSLANQLNQGQAADAQRQGQEAAYQAQSQYLDPQFSQQAESLSAKLAAQGLAPGSQAYNNAMLNFQNEKQRAYSNAQNQAIMTGSQLGAQNLQNQIAGLSAQGGLLQGQLGALGNDINSINARTGINQLGYQNLGSIAGLIPGYSGPAQSGSNAADIMGAMNNQYQGQLGAYNARQQSANATTSSLAGLAGIAAMAFF
jgi:hypothetical protein